MIGLETGVLRLGGVLAAADWGLRGLGEALR